MVKPNKKERDLARELLVEGRSIEDAANLTKLPIEQVTHIDTWLKGKMGKRWLEEVHPEKVAQRGGQAPPGPEMPEGAAPEEPQGPEIGDGLLEAQFEEARRKAAQSPAPAPASQFARQVTYAPPQPTAAFQSRPQRQMAVIEDGPNGMRVVQRMPAEWAPPGPDTIEVPGLPAAGKGRGNVNVTPWTLVWYDTAAAEYRQKFGEDYPGGLPQFLEDSVIGVMDFRKRKFVYMEGV